MVDVNKSIQNHADFIPDNVIVFVGYMPTRTRTSLMKNRFCTMAYMIFRRKYSNEKKIYCKNLQDKTHKRIEMTKYILSENKIVETTEELRITIEIENVTQPWLRMEDMTTAVCMADHFVEPNINLKGELILSLSEVLKDFEKEFPGLVHMQEPACKSTAPLKSDTLIVVKVQVGLSGATTACVANGFYMKLELSRSNGDPDMKEKCLLSNDIFDHWFVSQGLQTEPSIVAEEALIFANEAFDVLGFTKDEKYNIFKNTAAMMHMGKFTNDFVPVGGKEQAEVKNNTNVQNVAALLVIAEPKLRYEHYHLLPAVLYLYVPEKTTGVIINTGDGAPRPIQVYEKAALPHDRVQIDPAEHTDTKSLGKSYTEGRYICTTTGEHNYAQDVERKPVLEQEMSTGQPSFRNLAVETKTRRSLGTLTVLTRIWTKSNNMV